MKYFVTIYIKNMQMLSIVPHAFLSLTHKHPDELDKQDEALKQEQLKNAHWKDFNKRWYENIYPSILSDEFVGEGFWGFGPESKVWKSGKVFENNQYNHEPYENIEQPNDNLYKKTDIRSSSTFQSNNRCVFEISQEQYEKLLELIKQDVLATLYIDKNSSAPATQQLKYDLTNNNCTTWVLNKLDSIGIEIIDNEEWLPDNISVRDSLLRKFHYLQYLYAVFQKFQSIDSNLESIAGAKAFRTWARSMTQNKIFCALKIKGDITKGLDISTECKRTITQNQRYYNNKLKDFITKSSDFMRVYNRINEQLERLITKAKNLGYTNIQGDFTFIVWNDEIQTRMLLDSKHRDESTKDYIAYPIEQIDPNIPACNWTLNHNASFILVLRDEMLCKTMYKNYHYPNMSESFIDSINKSHIAIVSGNDNLSYWSKSIHTLRKSIVYEE